MQSLTVLLSCDTWYKIIGSLSVLGRGAVIGEQMAFVSHFPLLSSLIVTFTLRTFAVWGRSRIILGLLGSIGLFSFILDVVRCI